MSIGIIMVQEMVIPVFSLPQKLYLLGRLVIS